MQSSTANSSFVALTSQPQRGEVLGNAIALNLDHFPELHWITDYITALQTLQTERDRLSLDIQAIEQEGEAYYDQWIEPYTKTKNSKQYHYHQVRWLTGEYKKSGQAKVKTKHLSHRQVAEVRAAIDRGHQVKALQKQQYLIDERIAELKQKLQTAGKDLQRAIAQII
jgi:chaperonin cofactor prefoldin